MRSALASRALRAFRVRGPLRVALIAGHRLRRLFVANEAHIWLALRLCADRPRRALPEGLVLRRALDADLGLVEQLPDAGAAAVLRRELRPGHELWIVTNANRVAFACWLHREEAPVFAAPGGNLRLPSGVCCIEDSATAPEFRGRGIAPAAWSSIATAAEADGYSAIITKVEVDNQASLRALEKAGFSEIARMHLVRRWLNTRVTLSAIHEEIGAELSNRLSR
jgi:ribosomal protein S18 acetylase RimI-like enzyme